VSIISPAQQIAVVARHAWITAAIAIAAGLSLLAVAFQPEITAAINVWIDSTIFNHCFLILPVAAYLAWERREVVAISVPNPNPWIGLAAIPVAVCWFLAERIGVMEGRQIMAMTLVQILVASVLGAKLWRLLSAPLLYLYFLIPFGEYLQHPLQQFTVAFINTGLDVFQIPHFIDGVLIEIPEGSFSVTEACAGLRFLIASIAFGGFYACVMYASLLRRFVFLALSFVVPIFANGLRALGIVVIGHYVGSSEAVAADHVLYGWVFFSLVTFLLIVIGLGFREKIRFVVPEECLVYRPGILWKAISATSVLVLVAVSPRAMADMLDHTQLGGPSVAGVRLAAPSDCVEAPLPSSSPGDDRQEAGGTVRSQAYRCGTDLFLTTIRIYPTRVGARRVFTDLRAGVIQPEWDAITTTSIEVGSGSQEQRWSETEFGYRGLVAVVASGLWVDGLPVHGLPARLRLALNSLRGSSISPVTVVVTYKGSREPGYARGALGRFLRGTTLAFSPSAP
jgi:exosortase A